MLYRTIIMIAALPVLGPQDGPAPKDRPRITLDETGDFHRLVKELEERAGERIRLRRGIESRDVSIKVKDAGFFEALDALCRAHKEATYCPEDEDYTDRDELSIAAGPWFEYKASYHGHFKTAVVSMKRYVQATPRGEFSHVQVEIALFGPPWTLVPRGSHVDYENGVDKAVAADGRDIRLPGDGNPPVDGMDLADGSNIRGNVMFRRIYLRDFDISKGLKTLSGTMKVRTVETQIVRLKCEAGASIETPRGRLSVDGVKELEKFESGKSTWRISLSFTPNEEAKERGVGISDVLLQRVSYDGDATWRSMNLPMREWSFPVETNSLERAPAWLKFKTMTAEREHEIPFTFADVALSRDY